jgi:hypothetical protein
MYQSELATPETRGFMTCMHGVMFAVGQVRLFSLNLVRYEWGRQTIGSYILPFRFNLSQV